MIFEAIQEFKQEAEYIDIKRQEAIKALGNKWLLAVPVQKKESK